MRADSSGFEIYVVPPQKKPHRRVNRRRPRELMERIQRPLFARAPSAI